MVLVEELIHRLASSNARLTLLVFVQAPDEVTLLPRLDYRTSAEVEAIYLPVADTDPAALVSEIGDLDVVLALSHVLGKERLYPAIDAVRSTSKLLDPAVVGTARYDSRWISRKRYSPPIMVVTRDLHRLTRTGRALPAPTLYDSAFLCRGTVHQAPRTGRAARHGDRGRSRAAGWRTGRCGNGLAVHDWSTGRCRSSRQLIGVDATRGREFRPPTHAEPVAIAATNGSPGIVRGALCCSDEFFTPFRSYEWTRSCAAIGVQRGLRRRAEAWSRVCLLDLRRSPSAGRRRGGSWCQVP